MFNPFTADWGNVGFQVGGFDGAKAVNNADGTVTFTIKTWPAPIPSGVARRVEQRKTAASLACRLPDPMRYLIAFIAGWSKLRVQRRRQHGTRSG